eukprot:CAMPEP_0194049634 /NCGR_PEP_ID=MMETSP0009_2-20130614/30801_1 /TAXON_ID=210454 /ORGANISM="Grammatophora oceanica, Strain CCMP 410" /LENGTH=67 /DNA_ID=CAMNT_0038695835 /DNA_START=54 /DNA_END=253 /DNA_ORIENTATION=-
MSMVRRTAMVAAFKTTTQDIVADEDDDDAFAHSHPGSLGYSNSSGNCFASFNELSPSCTHGPGGSKP